MEFAKRFHTELVPIVETLSNAKMNWELISVGLPRDMWSKLFVKFLYKWSGDWTDILSVNLPPTLENKDPEILKETQRDPNCQKGPKMDPVPTIGTLLDIVPLQHHCSQVGPLQGIRVPPPGDLFVDLGALWVSFLCRRPHLQTVLNHLMPFDREIMGTQDWKRITKHTWNFHR